MFPLPHLLLGVLLPSLKPQASCPQLYLKPSLRCTLDPKPARLPKNRALENASSPASSEFLNGGTLLLAHKYAINFFTLIPLYTSILICTKTSIGFLCICFLQSLPMFSTFHSVFCTCYLPKLNQMVSSQSLLSCIIKCIYTVDCSFFLDTLNFWDVTLSLSDCGHSCLVHLL